MKKFLWIFLSIIAIFIINTCVDNNKYKLLIALCVLIFGLSFLLSGELRKKNRILKKVSDVLSSGIYYSIYELVKDATFEQMFAFLLEDLDNLCLFKVDDGEYRNEKARAFFENNKSLFQKGWNFFLLKQGNDFFVVRVYISPGCVLGPNVGRLCDDGEWNASSRRSVVVPRDYCDCF